MAFADVPYLCNLCTDFRYILTFLLSQVEINVTIREEDELSVIHLSKNDIIGKRQWYERYDLLNVVIISVGNTAEKHMLHRLLHTLFATDMSVEEKSTILEEEYDIKMESGRREMLSTMCNLSEGIRDRALIQGIGIGCERGQDRVNSLIRMMIQNGRADDIEKAVSNREYQESLFLEYGI